MPSSSPASASNYRTYVDWIAWDDYVLKHLAGKIDYLSVHRYVREALAGDTSFPGMMSLGLEVDDKIEVIEALIKAAMQAESGSTRPIYISFDEWSAGAGGGGGATLTGSLLLAQHLNSFNPFPMVRHAGGKLRPLSFCRLYFRTRALQSMFASVKFAASVCAAPTNQSN